MGEALIQHDGIDGITFTGSYKVGMHLLRTQAARAFPRPCIAEMCGKNAVIVTAGADLDIAAKGIVRSTFGMSGQKCSALSRVYVDRRVADNLIERLQAAMAGLAIGNPQVEETWMGPVATSAAFKRFAGYCEALQAPHARVIAGGSPLRDGDFGKGFFCAPTLAEASLDHPLWQEEMFAPVVMLGRVASAQ